MSFSNLLRREQRKPAATPRMPERPASATGSVEFWRAFLGQDARPKAAYVPDTAPEAFEPPAATVRAASPEPAGLSVEPAEIERELGLSRFASVRALQRLRREFALKNHPDRMPTTLRARATKRMMIANALIDSAMKRFPFGTARAPRARPFETGERV